MVIKVLLLINYYKSSSNFKDRLIVIIKLDLRMVNCG
jgi:hypothetical protein